MTFDQARNQAEDKLRREVEPTLAKKKATELLAAAKSPAELEQLSKAAGLEVKNDTNFDSYTFPGAGSARSSTGYQAKNFLHQLQEGAVASAPIKVGTSYLVYAAKKKVEADLSLLPQQRAGLRQSLLNERKNAATEAILKGLRTQYEKDGQLKINQDAIDKYFSQPGTTQP